MTNEDAQKLDNGLYKIYWLPSGSSLAAIGRLQDGSVWMAPTNWVAPTAEGIATVEFWEQVRKVQKLA